MQHQHHSDQLHFVMQKVFVHVYTGILACLLLFQDLWRAKVMSGALKTSKWSKLSNERLAEQSDTPHHSASNTLPDRSKNNPLGLSLCSFFAHKLQSHQNR